MKKNYFTVYLYKFYYIYILGIYNKIMNRILELIKIIQCTKKLYLQVVILFEVLIRISIGQSHNHSQFIF